MVKRMVVLSIIIIALFFGGIYFLYPKIYHNDSQKTENVIDETTGNPDYIWQTIPPDAPHGRTISWIGTKNDVGTLELSYAGHCDVSYEVKPVDFTDDEAVYTVKLRSLEPNTEYSFRVTSGENYSDWYEFTTPTENKKTCSALIFGDSQASDYSVWGKTANAAYKKFKNADFFINMGDLVDNGSDIEQWRAWLAAIADFSPELPAVPVIGNHETCALDGKPADPEVFEKLFSVPEDSTYAIQKHAYSFDYGPVHFVVLDTQAAEEKQKLPNLINDQKEWLDADLSMSKQPWKIVLMHRPAWKIPPDGSLSDIGEAFVPVINKNHVDAVLSGHVHSYSRTQPTSFGQGNISSVYISAGRSGDKTWDKSPRKAEDEVFYNPLDEPMYLTLKADEHNLTVKAYKLDGSLIDTWQVSK